MNYFLSLLAILLTLMLTGESRADGKISLQNNFYETNSGGHEYKPMVGVSVYEWLVGKLNLKNKTLLIYCIFDTTL